jgi:putative hydrolase of the HAD superfamily
MIQYVFFDVAGTLLGKPSLFLNIQKILGVFGYNIALEEIKQKHKLLSEVICFPDRTDASFYRKFNSELILLFGIVPSNEMLSAIFENCTSLPWEAYKDTDVLKEIKLPIGIISNFNNTLKGKLDTFFGPVFSDVIVSEELGIAKPEIGFFERALERIPFEPKDVLFIGDSIKLDLEPASQLGFKTLIVDRDNFYPSLANRIQSLEEIKQYL